MEHPKIRSFNEACKITREQQAEGKKVVFCYGMFDLIHRGHAELFVEAKEKGDILVVGVDSDNNTKFFKGKDRPVIKATDRAYMVSCMSPVDYVYVFKDMGSKDVETFYSEYCRRLMPDLIASCEKPSDSDHRQKRSEKLGIRTVNLGTVYENGTTGIIDRIRNHS